MSRKAPVKSNPSASSSLTASSRSSSQASRLAPATPSPTKLLGSPAEGPLYKVPTLPPRRKRLKNRHVAPPGPPNAEDLQGLELESMRGQLQQLTTVGVEYRHKFDQLFHAHQMMVQTERQRAQDLAEEAEEAHARVEFLEGELQESMDETSRLRAELMQTKDQLLHAARFQETYDERVVVEREQATTEVLVTELRSETQRQTEAMEALKQENDELQIVIQSSTTDLADAQREADGLRAEIHRLQEMPISPKENTEDLDQLRSEIAGLLETNHKITVDLERAVMEAAESREASQRAIEQEGTSAQALQRAEATNVELISRVEHLTAASDRMEKDHQSALREASVREEELRQKHQQVCDDLQDIQEQVQRQKEVDAKMWDEAESLWRCTAEKEVDAVRQEVQNALTTRWEDEERALMHRLQACQDHRDDLQCALASRSRELEEVNEQLHRCAFEREALLGALREADSNMQDLAHDLEASQHRLSETGMHRARWEKERETLRDEVDDLRDVLQRQHVSFRDREAHLFHQLEITERAAQADLIEWKRSTGRLDNAEWDERTRLEDAQLDSWHQIVQLERHSRWVGTTYEDKLRFAALQSQGITQRLLSTVPADEEMDRYGITRSETDVRRLHARHMAEASRCIKELLSDRQQQRHLLLREELHERNVIGDLAEMGHNMLQHVAATCRQHLVSLMDARRSDVGHQLESVASVEAAVRSMWLLLEDTEREAVRLAWKLEGERLTRELAIRHVEDARRERQLEMAAEKDEEVYKLYTQCEHLTETVQSLEHQLRAAKETEIALQDQAGSAAQERDQMHEACQQKLEEENKQHEQQLAKVLEIQQNDREEADALRGQIRTTQTELEEARQKSISLSSELQLSQNEVSRLVLMVDEYYVDRTALQAHLQQQQNLVAAGQGDAIRVLAQVEEDFSRYAKDLAEAVCRRDALEKELCAEREAKVAIQNERQRCEEAAQCCRRDLDARSEQVMQTLAELTRHREAADQVQEERALLQAQCTELQETLDRLRETLGPVVPDKEGDIQAAVNSLVAIALLEQQRREEAAESAVVERLSLGSASAVSVGVECQLHASEDCATRVAVLENRLAAMSADMVVATTSLMEHKQQVEDHKQCPRTIQNLTDEATTLRAQLAVEREKATTEYQLTLTELRTEADRHAGVGDTLRRGNAELQAQYMADVAALQATSPIEWTTNHHFRSSYRWY